MQVFSSPLTSAGHAGETALSQGSRLNGQNGRIQKQADDLREEPAAGSSSPSKQSFGPNAGNVKVIVGSGGDQAVISMGKNPAVPAAESSAPAASAQAGMGRRQKALIDDINLPQISDEAKATVANLEHSAEDLRQRDAALDAEISLHVKDLAQALQTPDTSAPIGEDGEFEGDSETILEQILSEQKAMTPEEQLRRQKMEQAAGNATRIAAPGSNGVAQTNEPEYAAPATGSAEHIDKYL